ncbi:MAG: cytochrome C oxidase subunit IV family protein [Verrucomicrobiaceae bacterium]|nr:cytochrome C oxidase subunit IV family protein [Verrucomicrobiaceae bacterium]
MAEVTHDFSKTKRTYAKVGIALGIFTIITVALGLFPPLDVGPPGPTPGDFLIGLSVATCKASLVALIFMHLNHERGLIYKLMLFTSILAFCLIVVTLFAGFDPIVEQYETLKTTGGWLLKLRPQ